MYSVKEIYYTLQGEGAQTGRAAVFCRFAGCNLWSGREADRATAICKFCDTDFADTNGAGGGKFASAAELAATVNEKWTSERVWGKRFVVCTGGEPLLQLDKALVSALRALDFEIAVETNGTIAAPANLDWICVSPKADAELKLRRGDELKLVYPQPGVEPALFEGLPFKHFFLQPMHAWTARIAPPTRKLATLRYCLDHPKWRLSLQTHKYLGIP